MVLAYHLVWTAYGWWLPNDPRGSMSHEIASDVIAALGKIHHGRKRVQPASREIRRFYAQARDALKSPLLTFTDSEGLEVARGFEEVMREQRYTCYACAVMPDHVHLIVRKHRDSAETMIDRLQAGSFERVIALGERRSDHPVWGGPGWKVFLDSPEDIERTIGYAEANPDEHGMPSQHWHFVTKYDGWPFHRKES